MQGAGHAGACQQRCCLPNLVPSKPHASLCRHQGELKDAQRVQRPHDRCQAWWVADTPAPRAGSRHGLDQPCLARRLVIWHACHAIMPLTLPYTPPLLFCAGYRETVELLLQRKADPSATDRRGQTAADVCKDEALKQLLLEAQAQRQASAAGSEWCCAVQRCAALRCAALRHTRCELWGARAESSGGGQGRY